MRCVLLKLFILVSGCITSCTSNQTYDQKLKEISQHTVPTITSEQLQNWQKSKQKITIIDTRSEAEFKVSQLQQARFLDYENHTGTDLQKFPKDQKIVVYCSVGYRSERVGEKLQQIGYSNVYNLYGGIFSWVNSGRPVYSQGRQTNKIHGYAPGWGKWLKKGDIVYE